MFLDGRSYRCGGEERRSPQRNPFLKGRLRGRHCDCDSFCQGGTGRSACKEGEGWERGLLGRWGFRPWRGTNPALPAGGANSGPSLPRLGLDCWECSIAGQGRIASIKSKNFWKPVRRAALAEVIAHALHI